MAITAGMLNRVCLGALALAMAFAAAPAAAQASGTPATPSDTAGVPGGVSQQPAIGQQDIVVTAQKRSERLRDVPLSVTAASGSQLRQLNITNTEGLEKITPGFTALTTQYGTPVYTIRGVGFYDVSVAAAPAVSLYVDQVPLPYSLMAEGASLDLERVEILKGPQGTLFGQNSTGGAINYIAAKPTKSFEAGGDVTYGRFDRFDVNAYISGPLTDTLGVRAAVRRETRGDWQRSYTRADTLGQRDFLALRLLVDWTPSDRLSFELNANAWRDKSDTVAPQFIGYLPTNPVGYADAMAALKNYPIAPADPRAADWDPGTSFRRDDKFYQIALHGDWRVSDDVTLSTISSFLRYTPFIPSDSDGTSYQNLLPRVGGTVKSWQQEVRLAGDSGALKWMLGGNYANDISDERDDLSLNATNSGVGPFRYNRIFIDNRQNVKTAAVFGSLDYKLTPALTAQVSARYTDQRRAFDGCLRDTGDGKLAAAFSFLSSSLSGTKVVIPPGACVTFADATPTPVSIVSNSLNQSNVSFRAGLNWKPMPNTMIYANVAQGFKAGGYSTIPGVRVAQYTPASQEKLVAYETGVKTSALDGAVQLDAALFYYDYSNKQIRGYVQTGAPFGNLPVLVNVPKGTARGAEVNLVVRPSSRLTFQGGGSYVDTRVTGPYLVNDQAGNLVDAGGEAFPSAPKWQVNGDVNYEAPVHGEVSAFAGGHVNYRSAAVAFLGGNPLFNIKGYALLGLRAGVESVAAAWRIELFGDNVTNTFYTVNASHPVDSFNRIVGMPATYGIRLGIKFR